MLLVSNRHSEHSLPHRKDEDMETEIRELEGKSTQNISLQLPRPYRFLARQTDTSFTKVPLHRLFLSKTNCAPLSLSPIVKETSNTVNLSDKIIVSGGTITDDIRLTEVPELTINAAKDCILNTGGEQEDYWETSKHLDPERNPTQY
ncbi:hypothetical protein B0H14DRAFT_699672 [Mycena olivaceomarginata]|nr:hypothetical protein B0H14DRAFT_699672 [Mycena olivaceomarginata]